MLQALGRTAGDCALECSPFNIGKSVSWIRCCSSNKNLQRLDGLVFSSRACVAGWMDGLTLKCKWRAVFQATEKKKKKKNSEITP